MKTVLLGEVAQIKQGYTFKPKYQGLQGMKWPYIKVADVGSPKNIKYLNVYLNSIDDQTLKEMAVKPFESGSIVFPRVGAALRNNNKRLLVGDCLTDDNVIVITVKKKDQCHNEYLYYWFVVKDLAKFCNDGLVPVINAKNLKGQKISLPPLPEQKAIADLLSTWDEAIEKTERLIQVKEKQLRQMSRWLLFGHKRLGNQKNELADGHFFKYPSDWALVKIGKVAKEVSARNGESDETVLSCSKYDGFVNSLDYFGKQVFSSDTSNYKVVKKGQFGYPSNHVEEGSIGLLEHCEKGIVSPIYVVFEASKEKVHSPFLYKLLKTDIYRHIFQVSTSSSVDRRGSLRWGDFSKIKVLIPSLEEQQEISETLSSAQHEIDLLKQLADKYKTQKRGLMQKMLTGEWRVKPEIVNQYMEA